MRRLRKTQRRRQQRGGNRKLQVVALVAAISPELAKSQDLYQLTQTWWNEGGIANSKALADGIVKSIEKASETVTLSVKEIAQELMKEQEEQDHTVHNILTNPPPVTPTELPNLPKVGDKFRVVDGHLRGNRVSFVRSEVVDDDEADPDEERKKVVYIVRILGDEDPSEYEEDPGNLVPISGGRRRPKQKTLRRKK